MAGTEATPRPDRWDAVAALLSANQRVLVVQATGWGKSAGVLGGHTGPPRRGRRPHHRHLATAGADARSGRRRRGGQDRAATVHSANRDDWISSFDELARDAVDVLSSPKASPTRTSRPCDAGPAQQRTARDRRSTLHLRLGFRLPPDYQRIAKLLVHLDASIPVLATTATATSRVIDDLTFNSGPTTESHPPPWRGGPSLAVVPASTRWKGSPGWPMRSGNSTVRGSSTA